MEQDGPQENTDPSAENFANLGDNYSLGEAEEYGLVVVAMGIPCWIRQAADKYSLAVGWEDEAAALSEIRAYREEQLHADTRTVRTLPDFPAGRWHALLFGLLLFVCYQFQLDHPAQVESLRTDSVAMIEGGEWHRAATALFLHGDYDHLMHNIAYGCLFGLLVGLSIGPTSGWLLIFLSGVGGNVINALHYGSEVAHLSIGASTAVFGAIGILTGFGIAASFLAPDSAPGARMIVPAAGGIAILGMYGFGGMEVDVMAHIFGFGAGVPLGLAAGIWRIFSASDQPSNARGRD